MSKASKPPKPPVTPLPESNSEETKKDPVSVNSQVIEILEGSRDAILELLKGTAYSLRSAVVLTSFNRMIMQFRVPGQAIQGHVRKKFPPLTPAPVKPGEQRSPATLVGEELSLEVNAIYEGFTERENDEIIDSLTDLQIRGVAKKAGMEVTETKPERLTNSFIDEIKESIKKKAASQALIENPRKVLIDKIEATEKQVADIADQKVIVEKALERETDPVKKENHQKRLSDLTEKESSLYSELEQLNNELLDAPDPA
jgi:hypothetical protein